MWEAVLVGQGGLYLAVCAIALLELRRTSSLVDFRRVLGSQRRFRTLPLVGWSDVFDAANEGDFDVGLLEVTRRTSERLLAPWGWLRVLGLVSSAIGFAAVAYSFSWLHQDHGLADLDPTRLTRFAAERAAISVSVAVATSATSAGLRSSLRDRVRGTLAGLRSLERVARSGWTAARTK